MSTSPLSRIVILPSDFSASKEGESKQERILDEKMGLLGSLSLARINHPRISAYVNSCLLYKIIISTIVSSSFV